MDATEIIIDPEFRDLLPSLSAEERAELAESLATEGCRDPLIVWNDRDKPILLDGHNRYAICTEKNIRFSIRRLPLPDRAAAALWILRNQLARRNLTPYARAQIALKREPYLAAQAKERQGSRTDLTTNIVPNSAQCSIKTRKEVAKLAGIGHDTLAKAKIIVAEADEATKADLRAGRTSIHAAYKKLRPPKAHARPPQSPPKAHPNPRPAEPAGPLLTKEEYEAMPHVAPGDATATRPKTKAPRHSRAYEHACDAVACLMRIAPCDPRRLEALDHVNQWIAHNR